VADDYFCPEQSQKPKVIGHEQICINSIIGRGHRFFIIPECLIDKGAG
jgi:hypothetical protein